MHSGETWRLGHRPALDGLRGIAVLLVVVSHLSIDSGVVRSLGPVGVGVFFTLSGFLITSLLLEERRASTQVDLRRFFARRAARLLPAMLVCVVVVVSASVLLSPAGGGEWSMAIGALTYSANWINASGGGGGALGHMWSLSIEEQFYLVWPLAFIVLSRFGRRALTVGLACATLTSMILCVALITQGWERVYYGSDTRAAGLLVGCLLAVWLHERPTPRGSALVAVAALTSAASFASWQPALLFTIAPIPIAVLTALTIVASVGARPVALLEWRPIRLVGRRAYGLYLWHYPVAVAAEHLLDDPSMLEMGICVIPASTVLTALSWQFIEAPWSSRRDSPRSGAGAMVSVPRTGVPTAV